MSRTMRRASRSPTPKWKLSTSAAPRSILNGTTPSTRVRKTCSSYFCGSPKQYPDFPCDKIEEFLIDWIAMGYAPENYSQAQQDELDRLTERWVADHMRRSRTAKNGKRTRHS